MNRVKNCSCPGLGKSWLTSWFKNFDPFVLNRYKDLVTSLKGIHYDTLGPYEARGLRAFKKMNIAARKNCFYNVRADMVNYYKSKLI